MLDKNNTRKILHIELKNKPRTGNTQVWKQKESSVRVAKLKKLLWLLSCHIEFIIIIIIGYFIFYCIFSITIYPSYTLFHLQPPPSPSTIATLLMPGDWVLGYSDIDIRSIFKVSDFKLMVYRWTTCLKDRAMKIYPFLEYGMDKLSLTLLGAKKEISNPPEAVSGKQITSEE